MVCRSDFCRVNFDFSLPAIIASMLSTHISLSDVCVTTTSVLSWGLPLAGLRLTN